MNRDFGIGDLMIITDHVNLFPEHPLRGPNDERLGTRFPDMSQPYDHALINAAKEIARELEIEVKTGVYVGLQGPTFETPAEYRWLHVIGGDAVGMSTVPEVIVARHGGMRVFALSVITDIGISDTPVTITHEEVLEAANAAAPKMAAIVAELVKRVG
jgi:purine-nucleoside phosphorylase